MGSPAFPPAPRTRQLAVDIFSEDMQAGQQLYAENCAACHNADGTGGIGANLHHIGTTTSLRQTESLIKNPIGVVMPRFYPATLSDVQVRQVSEYLRTTFH